MAIDAMRLLCVLRGQSNAPQQVLPVGDSFKVVGVDTGAVSAEVVSNESYGNLPTDKLITKAVRVHWPRLDEEYTVSVTGLGAYPYPAIISSSLVNVTPKSRCECVWIELKLDAAQSRAKLPPPTGEV